MADQPSTRRWPYVLLTLAAVAGASIGFSGYAMAGSFGSAAPEHAAHWERVAYGYLALWLVSLLVLVASIGVLWRRSRRGRGGAEG